FGVSKPSTKLLHSFPLNERKRTLSSIMTTTFISPINLSRYSSLLLSLDLHAFCLLPNGEFVFVDEFTGGPCLLSKVMVFRLSINSRRPLLAIHFGGNFSPCFHPTVMVSLISHNFSISDQHEM